LDLPQRTTLQIGLIYAFRLFQNIRRCEVAAFNQNQGTARRAAHQDRTARHEGADGFTGFDRRTPEQREADNREKARKLGVSAKCFK
jgi:hypothetical protein